ncbi:flavodoxin domain-containing protein [Neobacillus sp. LXY-1]|uniref:flavodoxin domain-containing protein n=1 Tax=Neobacillus sp. LXY-1 TaxID=3379133 RepID=UPI003EDFE33C
MSIAIIYSSRTGNTQELATVMKQLFQLQGVMADCLPVNGLPLSTIKAYTGIIVGTYTWGDGEIPPEMVPLYHAFENQEVAHLTTGVIGTGDSFYPHFCGAVDAFRDMLYVHTSLAVTLKVELSPQLSDMEKCRRFVGLFLEKYEKVKKQSEWVVNETC